MLERHQIIVLVGEGKRQLTDEEWVQFQERLSNEEIEFSSHMDNVGESLEKIDLMNIMKFDELEPILELFKEDNHSWKKSNKHKHPAFRRK